MAEHPHRWQLMRHATYNGFAAICEDLITSGDMVRNTAAASAIAVGVYALNKPFSITDGLPTAAIVAFLQAVRLLINGSIPVYHKALGHDLRRDLLLNHEYNLEVLSHLYSKEWVRDLMTWAGTRNAMDLESAYKIVKKVRSLDDVDGKETVLSNEMIQRCAPKPNEKIRVLDVNAIQLLAQLTSDSLPSELKKLDEEFRKSPSPLDASLDDISEIARKIRSISTPVRSYFLYRPIVGITSFCKRSKKTLQAPNNA